MGHFVLVGGQRQRRLLIETLNLHLNYKYNIGFYDIGTRGKIYFKWEACPKVWEEFKDQRPWFSFIWPTYKLRQRLPWKRKLPF